MDKQTVLAFILIGLILILMPYFQRLVMPEMESHPDSMQEQQREKETVWKETVKQAAEAKLKKEGAVTSMELLQGKEEVPEREIFIETPLYKGIISSRGGTIKEWGLKKYTYDNGDPIEIVRKGLAPNMSIGIVKSNGDTLMAHNFDFKISGTKEKSDGCQWVSFGPDGAGTIKLELDLGQGSKIEKIMTFYEDRYYSDIVLRLYKIKPLTLNNEYLVIWGTSLSPTESDVMHDLSYSKIYALMGSELESYEVAEGIGEKKRYEGTTKWMATRTKYFTAAIMPRNQSGKAVIFSGEAKEITEDVAIRNYEGIIVMPLNEEKMQEHNFQLLLGPLEYNLITSFEMELERMMDFGWMWIRPISKLIYHVFIFLHQYIPNYGFAIIVFSILLKILFYPLTKASYKSMSEMRKLQPEMALLKEKYKDDPKKMQKATMRLYKEHKVNPLGGCLPLLLQMPVFFALYPVFYSVIEFRAAPFIWWIKDLSQPDTVMQLSFSLPMYGDKVNILPIIWAVSMLFQNAMTMKDPKQKFMVYVMPILMLLFFNRLPSGLVLYWTVFNIFSMMQQFLVKDKSHVSPAPAKN